METNAYKSQRDALNAVMDIIESTYAHDPETGERIDGDSPVSGADVVDALCSIEELVAEALANCDLTGIYLRLEGGAIIGPYRNGQQAEADAARHNGSIILRL